MTWVRIDDEFALHRKVRRAGAHGVALHVAALCYASRHETDGKIPKDDLESVWPWGEIKMEKTVAKLLAAGLWDDVGDAYQLHDYLEYNPSKAQLEKERHAKSERQRKWRETQQRRDVDASTDAHATNDSRVSSLAVTLAPRTRAPAGPGAPVPVPSRPVPIPEERDQNPRAPLNSDPDSDDGWIVVAGEYQSRWESATNTAWMSHGKNRDELAIVWRWAEAQSKRDGTTALATVTALLDRYFADAWAQSKQWPLGHLARNPAKYMHEAQQEMTREAIEARRASIEWERNETERKASEAYGAGRYDESNLLRAAAEKLGTRLGALGPARSNNARR